MAKDAVTFIRALDLGRVDLLGFSMSGMIAQVIAQDEPQLVRKLILAGTGRARGEGIKNVTRISHLDTIRALLTFQDPKQFLFFTRTPNGRQAGKEFLARLKERSQNRDKAISLRSNAAQLKAIHRWGLEQPSDLSVIHQPVLVANGESDKMVPTKNTAASSRSTHSSPAQLSNSSDSRAGARGPGHNQREHPRGRTHVTPVRGVQHELVAGAEPDAGVDDLASLDHQPGIAERPQAVVDVLIEHDQIGDLSGHQRAPPDPEQVGRASRGRAQDFRASSASARARTGSPAAGSPAQNVTAFKRFR